LNNATKDMTDGNMFTLNDEFGNQSAGLHFSKVKIITIGEAIRLAEYEGIFNAVNLEMTEHAVSKIERKTVIPDATISLFNENFDKLPDEEKWKASLNIKGVTWRCKFCNAMLGRKRPEPGKQKNCVNCYEVLTTSAATGPFNFTFKPHFKHTN
jgi:hypothetical protein